MELKTDFLCIFIAVHFLLIGYGQILYNSKETVMNFQQLSRFVVLGENMERCEKNSKLCERTNEIVMDVLQSVLSNLHSSNISLLEDLVNDVCKRNPSLVFPHPAECQIYYNCSFNNSIYYDPSDQMSDYMEECSYPDMFSTKTLRCEKYTDVECGDRLEIKSECKYRIYYRRPCIFRCYSCNYYQQPDCEGKPDGMHFWRWVRGKAYYNICHQERVIERDECPFDPVWETLSRPFNGKCTSDYEMPIYSSICSRLGDGKYQTSEFYSEQFWLCRAYFICKNGIRTGEKCQDGTVFDAKSGQCKEGKFGFGRKCELYCDSDVYDVRNNSLHLAMKECPYPNFFSDTLQRCMNKYVSCGQRDELTGECARDNFDIRHSNVNSDHYKYPSCVNKSDGLYEHSVKNLSPYYMICEKQQYICEGYCPFDKFWKTQTFPFKGKCKSMFEIPKSEYVHGELPSCENQTSGTYQFPNRKCDAYYKCKNGEATGIKCLGNKTYDSNSGMCNVGTCSE